AIMRARDGHSVDWEAGYVRHLEWHRQAKDTFAWYSYSLWASTERQRWIIYATFGHSAAELSNPISPAEDERDNLINVLPHANSWGTASTNSCRHSRLEMVCRRRLLEWSTRRWSSTTVRARRSRRRLPPSNQNCGERRSGTDWSLAEMRHAMFVC